MRVIARLPIAILASTMAFAAIGCKGEPPAPPLAVGQQDTARNGGKISVDSFKLMKPDFVDAEGKAQKSLDGSENEVAVLRLKISNPTSSEITYKPLHFENASERVQLCTDPDPETGDRTDTPAIKLDEIKRIHIPGQRIEKQVVIPAGGSIFDDYLFDIPMKSGKQLVALVPGMIIGDTKGKVFKFYVGELKSVDPPAPSGMNETVSIDGMEVTINRVDMEYLELEPQEPPKTPLKYPYAYTKTPVLVVGVQIKNTGGESKNYNPSHTAQIEGINLSFDGTPLKRIKLEKSVFAKGQIRGTKSVAPGENVSDIFLFEPPASSSGTLDMTFSAHIFDVMDGIYKYRMDFQKTNPPKPDLEPYKAEAEAADGGDAADAAPAAE